MAIQLFINGQRVDLDANSVIAQTKQINDINSVSNRQTNYTNIFRLPKTAHNIRVFQFLSLPGNNSNVPYQKNECSLYSGSGECFVYKGWAVVTDTNESFETHIYDGIVDLYKAIENTNLSDYGLSELSHTKNISAVKASWATPNNPYLYILANYNGNTGDTASGIVNIDYLVPSVRVKYLWDKIFAQNNATYSGAVFNMQQFLNLYMTFPKGVRTSDSEEEIFSAADFTKDYVSNGYFFARYGSPTTYVTDKVLAIDNAHFKVFEAGTYRLDVVGTLKWGVFFGTQRKLFIGKNAEGVWADQVQPFQVIADNMVWGTYNIDTTANPILIDLEALDSVSVLAGYGDLQEMNLTITLTKLNYNQIDFDEALIDFSTKDFLNEVLHRFGLTMFKDKFSNNYHFLTLQELLQTSQITDWSDKYVKKVGETYTNGSYAQRNWFRYAYNDKEGSHNDGYIDVNNINLPDKKDVIKSKIYSPESYKEFYLTDDRNVYKLWDKEVVEDPAEGEEPVTYKGLDKRYYFLRAETMSQSITLVSNELGDTDTAINFYIDNYWKLSFRDAIQDYYAPMRLILDKTTLMEVELYLKEVDIVNFDFKRLYYIEQLASYFLVNKIINYIPNKVTKCELIRVLYGSQQPTLPDIAIYQVITNGNAITVYFTTALNVDFMYMQLFKDGVWLQSVPGNGESPYYYDSVLTGTTKVRMRAGTIYSNEVEITIPSTETINV